MVALIMAIVSLDASVRRCGSLRAKHRSFNQTRRSQEFIFLLLARGVRTHGRAI